MTSSDIKVYRYLLGLIAIQLDFGNWPHMAGFKKLGLQIATVTLEISLLILPEHQRGDPN